MPGEQQSLFVFKESTPKHHKYEMSEDDEIMLNRLRRKVFIYAKSDEDELYFRQRIASFLQDKEGYKTFTEVCWNMVWIRNNEGTMSNYLYFNDRSQKLFLDRTFFEWVKLVCRLINEELYVLDQYNKNLLGNGSA